MSPVHHLSKLNAKTDCRHCRRALSVDELRRVITNTYIRPDDHGMTGQERALLYRLTAGTGLRANEIRSLTRGSFSLRGAAPAVTIAAAYSKHRRQDVQPLPTELVADLDKHLQNKLPNARAFNIPQRTEVSRMWKADLAAAKQMWVTEASRAEERVEREKSPFLEYKTDAGQYADYHSLRHTFISNLVAGGVHPKTAQTLARHGTITLTMDRYTHVRMEDIDAALDVLPALSIPAGQVVKATGTDGETVARVSAHVSESGGIQRSSVELRGENSTQSGNNRIAQNASKLTESAHAAKVLSTPGGVAEWSIAPVLKTGRPARVS